MSYEILPASDVPENLKRIRKAWPFSRMKVGERVIITDRQDWEAACKTCHVTGSRKGFNFRTHWDAKHRGENGALRPQGTIWRVL